jgi:hypothetical protein
MSAHAKKNDEAPKHRWYKTFGGRLLTYWKSRPLEKRGIIAAIALAVLTYLQWYDLRHNFTVEQRAWLKPNLDWSNFATTNSVPLSVTNFGKHPAINPRMIFRMEIVDAKAGPSFIWKFRPHSDNQMSLIFPNDTSSVTA